MFSLDDHARLFPILHFRTRVISFLKDFIMPIQNLVKYDSQKQTTENQFFKKIIIKIQFIKIRIIIKPIKKTNKIFLDISHTIVVVVVNDKNALTRLL